MGILIEMAEATYGDLRGTISKKLDEQQIGLKTISNKGGYIADSILDTVLNRDAVKAAFPTAEDELVQFASGPGRKIFAIILQTFRKREDGQRIMKEFMNCCYDDAELPLTEEDVRSMRSNGCSGVSKIQTPTHCHCQEKLRGFHDILWDYPTLHSFSEKQWSFCVANFNKLEFGCVLEKNKLLPFKYQDLEHLAESTFSEVKKAEMLAGFQTIIETVSSPPSH